MPKTHHVTPHCCDHVQEVGSVLLLYDFQDLKDGTYKDKPPHWAVYALDTETGKFTATEVTHCPHCGKKLPELHERRLVRQRVCDPNMETKTCETCKKGLMQCHCYPPEYRWEAASAKHKFHKRL